jgi:DNA replicative helicase MCM subunit Mcm2 (Cdc46/Mcm family)
MQTKDKAGLYSAMEKGFITYDKANKHVKVDANINLFATANPTGDKFVGRTIETWKKQIPFDSALLSRFHLVFFIRKPDEKEFVDIAKKIVSNREKNIEVNDALFLMDYVEYSKNIDVKFDDKLKKQIVEFASKLKHDEDQFMVEVGPRIILGMMRLAKASARIEHRRVVEQKDLDRIFNLYKKSLYIKKTKK